MMALRTTAPGPMRTPLNTTDRSTVAPSSTLTSGARTEPVTVAPDRMHPLDTMVLAMMGGPWALVPTILAGGRLRMSV